MSEAVLNLVEYPNSSLVKNIWKHPSIHDSQKGIWKISIKRPNCLFIGGDVECCSFNTIC